MSHTNPDVPPARPRPRPQKPQTPDAARESSAVRASVLDAALQLGLGANPAVADWMFNNTLKEEDEDQIPTSPGLTHSEESPVSSPLSSRYPPTPSSPSSQNHSSNLNHKIATLHPQNAITVPFAVSSESRSLIPHITDPAKAPARPTTPSKLKKKRSGNKDGYDSDAGMLSDGKRKKDKKDKKNGKKNKEKDAEGVPPVPALSIPSVPSSSASFLTIPDTASETTVGGDGPRRRAKSLVKAPPKSQAAYSAPTSPFDARGYETDGGQKSKKKWAKKDTQEEEKDVKKTRGLFFRLGNKSKGDPDKGSLVESKDEKPPVLPIAERFATTLNKDTGAPMISLGSSEGRLGMDLGLGLSGDMFSAASPPSQTSTPAPPTVTPSSPTTAQSPALPASTNLSLPQPQLQSHISNSTPPVSFHPSSTSNGRPNSAGTNASVGTTARTSTSTNNTHSHSTAATRTSLATSISTSQSHSNYINGSLPLKGVTSRESSNNDVPSLTSSATFPQTPSKRRMLPFLGGQGKRGSSSSGDSHDKEKERERKRDEKGRKEREREKERNKEEKEEKKPMISLPLTRTGLDLGSTASSGAPDAPEVVVTPSNSTPQTTAMSVVPSTPHRPGPTNLFGDRPRSPSHPLLSRQQSSPQGGLSRQVSLSTLRADAPITGRTSPIPMARSTSPLPSSGRISPMPRGLTVTVGSPPSGRHSPLHGPPSKFSHYDIPPPSPPPLSPLPSVPAVTNAAATQNGNLSVNVGIAVTTGSPLPSPLLMTSPSFKGSGANGNGSGKAGNAPPTSFNPSSAAAGSALRARVQRRLSQQGGFPAPSTTSTGASAETGANTNGTVNGASNIPVINTPSVSRSTSIRGRESPFPVLPVSGNRNKLPLHTNNLSVNTNTSLPPRATSPRFAWEDDTSDKLSSRHEEEDDDGMEDVRGVLARFRESRIDDGWRKMEDEREAADGVIATRRSFEAFQWSDVPSIANSNISGNNPPVSPSPSSGLNVPVAGDRLSAMSGSSSGKYDSFMIEEYYGLGQGNSNGAVSGPSGPSASSTREAYGEDEYADDDDVEDASYYPDDEVPSSRRSRRRRSTLYLSDEENDPDVFASNKTARNSRWSGSIYSRASFLDTEKSGEARQRFLKHVEAMLDERGERIPPAPKVPPVPKLPEEFVAESKRAAAAARQQYLENEMKRTVGVGARKAPAGSGLGLGR